MSGPVHSKYIDALRGFAFLGVLIVHASQQIDNLPGVGVTSAGMYGVQLFFLLSAITLLRSVSVRSGKESFPIRNFFIRRIFRIAPLFWCGIAFSLFMEGCRPRYWAPNGIGLPHFVSTAFFLHGWTPTTITSVVPGGWSIAVEMTFYLLLPFLARRIPTFRVALLMACYSLVASIVLNRLLHPLILNAVPDNEKSLVTPFLFFWFPSQLPVFLMGFMVYYCLQSNAVMRFVGASHRPAIFSVMAICGLLGLTRVNSDLIPIHVFYALLFSVLILCLAAKPFTIAVNPFTCKLGTLSFSCYITHFAALAVTAHFITSDAFVFLPAYLIPFCQFAAVLMAGLALTIAVSSLTYFFIEKPGIKMGIY